MRSAVLSVVVLLVIAARGQEIGLRHLDEEAGLPSDCVLDLFIDRDNLLWIGTNKGLYRYDGFGFERIGAGTALDAVNIVGIHQDPRNGSMLLSAYGERLFRYKDGRVDEFRIMGEPACQSTAGCIEGFARLPDGRLRAHHDQRFSSYVIDPDKLVITTDPPSPMAAYGTITDEGGALFAWLTGSTTMGPPLYDSVRFHGRSLRLPVDRLGSLLLTIAPEADTLRSGALCLSHYADLYVLRADAAPLHQRFTSRILGVSQDRSGRLWVRLYGEGIRCFDEQLHALPIALSALDGTHVTDCVEDAGGGLWFSTIDRGLYYCASPDVRSLRSHAQFHAPWVSTIAAAAGGSVLVGCGDGRLWQAYADGRCVAFPGVETAGGREEIKGIQIDLDSVVHPGSLVLDVRMKDRRTTAPKDRNPHWRPLYDMVRLDDRRYLVAGISGLRIADLDHPDVGDTIVQGIRCFRLLQEPGKKTWLVATQRGLQRTDGTTAAPAFPEDTVLSGTIHDILFTGDSLWVATHTGLLLRTAEGTRIVELPGPVQRPQCRALALDPAGALLVGTLDGLFRIARGPSGGIRRFGRAQGLPNDAVYDVVSSGRWVWCVSGPDVCFFDPLRMRSPDMHTPLHVLDVLGWSGETIVTRGHTFEHVVDHVRLNLRGVNYARFGTDAFRYRLRAGSAWITAPRPVIDLLGLRPGEYRAEVQAAGADGEWGPSEEVRWTIRPAFWQLTWVRTLAIILVSAAVVGSAWYYRDRKQRMVLLGLEAQRHHHKALLAQMEPHFLYNALTSIQGFVSTGDVRSSARYLAKFAKLMRGLLNAAHAERITIDEEMAIMDNYCALEALRSDPPFTYTITKDDLLDGAARIPSFMVQPYVENAVRHGLRGLQGLRPGRLSIRFERTVEGMRCVVEDNGVGRAATAVAQQEGEGWRGLGTNINAERVRLLARIHRAEHIAVRTDDLRNNAGEATGTRVTLHMPLLPGSLESTNKGPTDEGSDRG